MNTREEIKKILKKRKKATGKELTEHLSISRQALNKHLKDLIQNGQLAKTGTTKGAVYHLHGSQLIQKFKRQYLLKGLEEDKVFQEIELLLSLKKKLRKNVLEIARYAFTEMLNNAIEHSQSNRCKIELKTDQYEFSFRIKDFGKGIFSTIAGKFDLPDENSALGELIKGKTTTMKERHSGEGIFFTSRSGDLAVFRSHKITLTFDNQARDTYAGESKYMAGTEVFFKISPQSKKRLEVIFRQYAPEEFDYRFERTRVLVKLFQAEYVSRSEAKRLLSGLEKFKEVILDLQGVKNIGQGFADEIFRVFLKQNPGIVIKYENANPTVEYMVKHVIDNKNHLGVDN